MADGGVRALEVVMGKAPESGVVRARYPGAVVEALVP
jgi:hypothetical protein